MFKGAYGRFAIKFDTFMIHIADKSHINYNMECQKEYFIFCLAGFLFTCVVGTFSHFFLSMGGQLFLGGAFVSCQRKHMGAS